MSTATLGRPQVMPNFEEKRIITSINRRIHEEFPDFGRELLDNYLKRNMFNDLLLTLMRHAPEHTLEQCISRVQKSGYTVTTGTGTEPRQTGTLRSVDAVDRRAVTHGSQTARMLTAWLDAGDDGLTSEEAKEKSGLSDRSCYWARATELYQAGLIEYVKDAFGTTVKRSMGPGTNPRNVYRITPFGSETALSLL